MTITKQPARNEYTANAGQTIFNYTFKIFAETDLNVYVTPAGEDCNDQSDLTTFYTVDGIGDEDGGKITLTTPTNQDDLVTIVSNIPSNRTVDYQNNGDFRSETVNNDFDRVVSIAKKIEDTANRTILLEQCQQGSKPLSMAKPEPGKVLVWNADGTGTENATVQDAGALNPWEKIPIPAITAGQTVLNINRQFTDAVVISSGTTLLETKGSFSVNQPAQGQIQLNTPLTGNEELEVWINSLSIFSGIGRNGYVTYADFGADLTGVVPADDAIIAAHEYANANNLPVRQNYGTVYWQNKTATVKTDTDLTGLTVRMDANSGTPDLTYSQPVMFLLPASEEPEVLDQSTIDSLNTTYQEYFKKLSHTLPNQVFGDYNGRLVKILGTELDVNRSGNPASFFNKQETVTISRRGEIEQPIYKGYEGTIDSIIIYGREVSQLSFKCPNLLLEEVASFGFLRIERSNTKVTGLVITEGSTWPSNIREVVQALNVADLVIEDWDCLAMPLGSTNAGGVYCFTGAHIVRLRAERLRGNGGWGFTGCNYLKSTTFFNCDINRIDCHWGAYDLTVINNRIINFGCLIAGGGTFTARDNEYHITGPLPSPIGESIVRAFFECRPDYGAEWDGDIIIDGLTYIIDPRYIEDLGTNQFDIIRMVPSPSDVDFGRAMYHGRNIVVKNAILRMDKTQQDNTADTTLSFNVLNYALVNVGAQDQYYPHTIIVDNISSTETPDKVKITAYIPPNYMAPSTRALSAAPSVANGDFNQLVKISNINCGRDNPAGGRALRGLVRFGLDWALATGGTYPNYLTDDEAIRPKFVVTDCYDADMGLAVVGSCEVYGGAVQKLQTRSDSIGPIFGPDETQMIVKCQGTRFRFTSSFTGADSFEFPDETWCFNCYFDDLIKRDGAPSPSGLADRFKGRGNRKTASTTSWTSTTPYLFDGENAYFERLGSPSGLDTPDFIGQECFDTAAQKIYKATGLSNTDWLILN